MERETAMKILKELHDNSLFSNRTALETIIPELADGNDERIRKDIIAYIKKANGEPNNILPSGSYCVLEMITWLQKQGEQKPEKKELKTIDWSKHIKYEPNSPSIIEQKQEWNEEDETMRKNIEGALDCYEGMVDGMVAEDWEEEKQWLKSLKDRVQPQSKIEWSEKDKEMAEDLIKGFQSPGKAHHLVHTSKEIADWLKSLKSKLQR